MTKKKVLCILLASAMALTVLTTGCGKKEEAQESKVESSVKEKVQKESLVYAILSAPSGVFNPLLSDTTYDSDVNSLVYSALLKFDDKGELVSDLAESYEISADQLSFTFKLKGNAKWHDGQAVTAKDVAFTFTAMADKDYTGANYSNVERLKGAADYHEGKVDHIEGIEVIDDQTIKFVFNEVYSPGLLNIGLSGIIPEHIWGKEAIAGWKENTGLLNAPIGSGPYKLSKYESGQAVTMERFDDYYGQKAKTKQFIFKVTNQDTAQVELTNGTVDIADVTSLKLKDIEMLESQGFKTISYPNQLIQYMGFNLRDSRFQDKNVRQAFMYGINRQAMVDQLIEGNGVIVNTPMLPSSWAYPTDASLNPYAYDVEKAKQLLKAAGWEDRNGNGIVENAKNEEFIVHLKYPTGNKTREQIAPIVQSNLKDIGIQLELSSMEFSTLMDQVVGNHDFELYLMGNNIGIDPDPKPYWHSTSASDKKGEYAWNISGFKNTEADKMMEAGLSTFDLNQRKEIYKNFAKLMNEELPWVYFFSQNTKLAYNSQLEGFNPTTHLNFRNVENWVVYEEK